MIMDETAAYKTAEAASEAGPIDQEMMALRMNVDRIDERLGVLVGRLDTILQPENEDPSDLTEVRVARSSDVAQTLQSINVRLDRIADAIVRIVSRVDL